jgi:NADH-quinone oxidoreductase subunit J
LVTVFYVACAVAVIATLLVVTRRNAAHALLYLIVSFLAVALMFFILGAPFAAALEVIIYAGAIMVFFVFVIMMLDIGIARKGQRWLPPELWLGPATLCAVLLGELVYILASGHAAPQPIREVPPKEVGVALLGPYVLGVELASLLLLAGLVGAYHLGRKDRPVEKKERRP